MLPSTLCAASVQAFAQATVCLPTYVPIGGSGFLFISFHLIVINLEFDMCFQRARHLTNPSLPGFFPTVCGDHTLLL